jgi:UDPglucose 6-dehydrogenase
MKNKKIFLCLIVNFLLGFPSIFCATQNVTVTVIGTGYVGLITGACCADFGHTVFCVDNDAAKIEQLTHNHIPIYEPGLAALVLKNVAGQRLHFTTDMAGAVDKSNVIVIAVGTPMGQNGCADLSAVYQVFAAIANHLDTYKIICIKSTVPIGTGHKMIQFLTQLGVDQNNFDLVSNPEFLREGSAINDFMYPDRIVIGGTNSAAIESIKNLYAPLLNAGVPCVCTSIVSSETIKYASNAFLATKLSFINEIADICDNSGADIEDVAKGMGLDKRIGTAFLRPGPGFGGSCFPKDCHELDNMGKSLGVTMHVVEAALARNEEQKRKPFEKLSALMRGELAGKSVALLGLAFKNNTDDIRYSPAITTIELLLQNHVHIRAFDPAAMQNMRKLFPDLCYAQSIDQALTGADAAIILTEWDEFKSIDLAQAALLMNQKIIVDARNILDPAQLKEHSFAYAMMGRP